jgi:N-acetyl-gamma-glutamyl-phosphate reductase
MDRTSATRSAARRGSRTRLLSDRLHRLVRPLVDARPDPADFPLTVNAVSGYSGGGKG